MIVKIYGTFFLFGRMLDYPNWFTIGTATISVTALIVGWQVNSEISSLHDEAARRASARLSYLIEAYNQRAISSSRCPEPRFFDMEESAVAKIRLLGNEVEISALQKFISEWNLSEGRKGDLNSLLNALRASVRFELQLPDLTGGIVAFRPRGYVVDPSQCAKGNIPSEVIIAPSY